MWAAAAGRRRAAGRRSSSQPVVEWSSTSRRKRAYICAELRTLAETVLMRVTLLDMLSTSRPHGPMHAEGRRKSVVLGQRDHCDVRAGPARLGALKRQVARSTATSWGRGERVLAVDEGCEETMYFGAAAHLTGLGRAPEDHRVKGDTVRARRCSVGPNTECLFRLPKIMRWHSDRVPVFRSAAHSRSENLPSHNCATALCEE